MPQLESDYQAGLIKRIKLALPGCVVYKNDTSYQQGFPDLTILYKTCWAVLEVKPKEPTSEDDFEPNQEWFIEQLDLMSFSACIYPENEKDVIHALQQSFRP